MSNIAAGFDAGSNKAFMSFVRYSYGSASEVQSLLHVALDSGYFDDRGLQNYFKRDSETKRMIGGFIKYLSRSGYMEIRIRSIVFPKTCGLRHTAYELRTTA